MPFKYTPDQRAAAMVVLERNRGDVHQTAAQTGIGIRTLYDWQRSMQAWLQHNPLPAQKTAEVPAFENDMDALAFIRQNILAELSRLSASLKDDPGFSTPYQRALVMSQLMDKLLKLDWHMKPYSHDPYRRENAETLFGSFIGRGNYPANDEEVYDDDEDGYYANPPA